MGKISKKTITIATRVKPSTMANLGLLLEAKARSPINRADILRQSLEILELIAISKHWIDPVSSTNEAVMTLKRQGINIMLTPASAETIAEMLSEEIQIPLFEPPAFQGDDALVATAKRLLEEIAKEGH